MKCKCGSYAINPHRYGRDKTDLDLCDVCYWRKRANSTQRLKAEIAALANEIERRTRDQVSISPSMVVERLRQLSAV